MEKTMGSAKRRQRMGKGAVILRVALATVLFSVFLKIDALVQVGNMLVGWAWPAVPVLLGITLVRMLLAGTVVLVVLPAILDLKKVRDGLPRYLRADPKAVSLGLLSFVVFCVLAAAISLSMGIFRGDLSAAFVHPDLRPDPDVIGWGYFLLALVPGIWEELAFRGLIQHKLRARFSIPLSILLSATFFGLYHFSNLLTQAPSQVIGGVIMAFAFGLAWGVMAVRSRSVVPAMLSHYLVDATGSFFLGVDGSNPALATGFFLLLTLTFAVCGILLAKVMYREPAPARAPQPVSP
jgi:membrane protease YdiL (CAAX protease family)